jgi:hypothetical protein
MIWLGAWLGTWRIGWALRTAFCLVRGVAAFVVVGYCQAAHLSGKVSMDSLRVAVGINYPHVVNTKAFQDQNSTWLLDDLYQTWR